LAGDPLRLLHRPMALILTKADRLGPDIIDGDSLARQQFGMTRHALETHCPENALFAVSCLKDAGPGKVLIAPTNLASPLDWLAAVLQVQDASRLDWLWNHAAGQVAVLERCVHCFARRYPEAREAAVHRERLRQARRQQRRRRIFAGTAAAACVMLSSWGYDA